jgi:hypothetical protein
VFILCRFTLIPPYIDACISGLLPKAKRAKTRHCGSLRPLLNAILLFGFRYWPHPLDEKLLKTEKTVLQRARLITKRIIAVKRPS